jgi:hypothetical protein
MYPLAQSQEFITLRYSEASQRIICPELAWQINSILIGKPAYQPLGNAQRSSKGNGWSRAYRIMARADGGCGRAAATSPSTFKANSNLSYS